MLSTCAFDLRPPSRQRDRRGVYEILLLSCPCLCFHSLTLDDGNAIGDDTQDVEHNVLEMLGADEWEGVAVGFLLAKVLYSSICNDGNVHYSCVVHTTAARPIVKTKTKPCFGTSTSTAVDIAHTPHHGPSPVYRCVYCLAGLRRCLRIVSPLKQSLAPLVMRV